MSSQTAALLWAACRIEPAPKDVATAIDAGADLDLAADIAVAERVSPLLWRALRAANVATGPAQWAATLEGDERRCYARSRLALPQLGPLALAPLGDAGLEALVIKGAALVGRYPDPALRPMDDLDLVLPPDHIEAAVRALEAAGWTRQPSTVARHEVNLTHSALPGFPIDLHRGLATWRTRANRLGSDQLWAARRPTTMCGAPSYVLPPELELVMLAAHAAKPFHTFDRLIWTVDVGVVVDHAEHAGGLDWDRVARLADETRCRTAVAVALEQATRLGVTSPAPLRRVAVSPARAAALAPVLSADWPVGKRGGEVRTTLRYALVDERRARFTLVVSEVLGKRARHAPLRAARLLRRRTRRAWRRMRAGPAGR